jgi:hypothetical protein
MPFCPVCEDEFRPGFTFCRRCNAQLVPELPDTEPPEPAPAEEIDHVASTGERDDPVGFTMEQDDWVEVHAGVPGAQFDLVRSLLEGAGVRVHVQTVGSGRWLSIGAIGAVTGVPTDFNAARILVSVDDADEAMNVLEDANSGRLAIGDGDIRPPRGIMATWGSSRAARVAVCLLLAIAS